MARAICGYAGVANIAFLIFCAKAERNDAQSCGAETGCERSANQDGPFKGLQTVVTDPTFVSISSLKEVP
jgi:hypothetical protein